MAFAVSVAYTLLPSTDASSSLAGSKGSAQLGVMLWKHAAASDWASGSYYGGMVCEQDEEHDASLVDSVSRVFSVHTCGVFGKVKRGKKKTSRTASSGASEPHERVQAARTQLAAKLRKGKGTLLHVNGDMHVRVFPVRYVEEEMINQDSRVLYGEAKWVSWAALIGAVKSNTASSVLCVDELPLHLPFVELLRGSSFVDDMNAMLEEAGLGHVIGDVEEEDVEDEVVEDLAAPAAGSASPVEVPSVFYSCRMCRKALFTVDSLVSHEAPVNSRKLKFRKGRQAQHACSSYFLDEAAVAAFGDRNTDFIEPEGKLCCPGCQTRVGSYAWAGSRCSCGAWVIPSVQVVRSKVDERRRITAVAVVRPATLDS